MHNATSIRSPRFPPAAARPFPLAACDMNGIAPAVADQNESDPDWQPI